MGPETVDRSRTELPGWLASLLGATAMGLTAKFATPRVTSLGADLAILLSLLAGTVVATCWLWPNRSTAWREHRGTLTVAVACSCGVAGVAALLEYLYFGLSRLSI